MLRELKRSLIRLSEQMRTKIIFIGLCIILLIGCGVDTDGDSIFPEEVKIVDLQPQSNYDAPINVTYLIDEFRVVDNSPNLMQRLEWENKTYIIFRYKGNCSADEYIGLRTNTC
ncbi:hypothetical protein LCGC14_2128900 [marine sediment metagenome]|uniref:Uncharacterized protein n=1 Tax=marine sediment metagenome TaxID=412755 RepID=A0A0F9GY62_9ZZZZ